MVTKNLGQAFFTVGTFFGGMCAGSLVSTIIAKLLRGNKYNHDLIYWKSNVLLALIGGCVCLYLTKKYTMKSYFLL
jgi:hypothetical protein